MLFFVVTQTSGPDAINVQSYRDSGGVSGGARAGLLSLAPSTTSRRTASPDQTTGKAREWSITLAVPGASPLAGSELLRNPDSGPMYPGRCRHCRSGRSRVAQVAAGAAPPALAAPVARQAVIAKFRRR